MVTTTAALEQGRNETLMTFFSTATRNLCCRVLILASIQESNNIHHHMSMSSSLSLLCDTSFVRAHKIQFHFIHVVYAVRASEEVSESFVAQHQRRRLIFNSTILFPQFHTS